MAVPSSLFANTATTTQIAPQRCQCCNSKKIHHLALKADSGGSDDRPDQDPMVPLSRVIMIPALVREGSRPNLTEGSLSTAMEFEEIEEHAGSDYNRNLVVPFSYKITRFRGSRVIWRQNHRLEDTCYLFTGKRLFENES
ncbi:hypothetical protein M5K25_008514 [Dendrobium thyrsiflorum]|uniref:Uncharacterized protein n=1 Tax=Dendrobium thyrsiflorum TaxID=117978 RepID=A0ABD0VG01_DENTH